MYSLNLVRGGGDNLPRIRSQTCSTETKHRSGVVSLTFA